ncbi:hypothetical protein Taro_012163, partial [Colocasia esculenta]|nr:hypothetical protein [Colocasia esculenta]
REAATAAAAGPREKQQIGGLALYGKIKVLKHLHSLPFLCSCDLNMIVVTEMSSDYALVPQTSFQTQATSNEEGRESAGMSSQAPRVPSVWPNITFPQVPQYTYPAQQAQPDVQASLLEPNEGLQRQIEGLQKQLELLQRQISVLTSIPDAGKGKMVATTLGASSSSGSGHDEESMPAQGHR